jgi:HEAT repeat protein
MSFSPPLVALLPSRRWRDLLVPSCALAVLLLTGPSPLGEAVAARKPPSSSTPRPGGTHQAEILRLLDSAEPLPREADWAPLGPETLAELSGLAQDAKAPEPRRTRAVAAMALVAGLDAVPLLAPLLEDRSESVRAATAQTLGRMGGAEARRVLEERLPLEEHQEVREAIQRGLSYLEP